MIVVQFQILMLNPAMSLQERSYSLHTKRGNFGRVKMGNDSYADIVGISDICVRANT